MINCFKLVTVLAGLALMTACGGSTPNNNTPNNNRGGNINPCDTNPFGATCVANFADERLTICMDEPTSARCTPTITPICDLDFNNDLCKGRAKYEEQLRCADGACVVEYADWVAGFDAPLNTEGDYTRTELFEFLQGTANGLDVGTVKFSNDIPTVHTLNLAVLVDGAKNGVAWFTGLSAVREARLGVTSEPRLYSGIFLGTDLGAPLVSGDVSASVPWVGNIGWVLYTSVRGNQIVSRNTDSKYFNLTVDFAKSEIRAFVKSSVISVDTDHFLLKATFDGTGRFNGTILHGAFEGSVENGTQSNVTTGVVTGIIGKQGAVGAFISNEADIATTNNAFAGGFVAAPPSE